MMEEKQSRRNFLRRSGAAALGMSILGSSACREESLSEAAALTPVRGPVLFDRISLAEWSLHKSLWSGALDHLDFAKETRTRYGLGAVEYVSTFFSDKVQDKAYLQEMKQRAEDHDVRSLVIMVDAEGSMASPDDKTRHQAVENHHKWVEAARLLGCHSIRVNAMGKGEPEVVKQAAIDSLGRLCEFAAPLGINIVVENHGGYSSDADWLAEVMRQVGRDNCGTLPDFGNFTVSIFPRKTFDRYDGTRKLMPFAKGVSAKTYHFTADGLAAGMDYTRLMKIVLEAGYTGYIGIEFEGYRMSESAGIFATKHLLQRMGAPRKTSS